MRGGGLRFQLTWYDFTSAYCPKITSPLTKLHIKFFSSHHLIHIFLPYFRHNFPTHILTLSTHSSPYFLSRTYLSQLHTLSYYSSRSPFLYPQHFYLPVYNSLNHMLINEILSSFSVVLLNIKTKYPIIFNFNQISHVRYIFYMLDSIKYQL